MTFQFISKEEQNFVVHCSKARIIQIRLLWGKKPDPRSPFNPGNTFWKPSSRSVFVFFSLYVFPASICVGVSITSNAMSRIKVSSSSVVVQNIASSVQLPLLVSPWQIWQHISMRSNFVSWYASAVSTAENLILSRSSKSLSAQTDPVEKPPLCYFIEVYSVCLGFCWSGHHQNHFNPDSKLTISKW